VKIAAIAMVYNEALLLPYFLRHYEYLDEIHVLYEIDTTDETLKILNKAPNVVIKNSHIEGGLDDVDKVNLLNSSLQGIKADWVYVLDSDEFIFPFNEAPYDFLSRQNYDVVRAAMFQAYRHRTDKDLDKSLPPVPQRIHGDSNLFSTVVKPNSCENTLYIKPIVVRPSSGVRFLPGNHFVEGNVKTSPEFYIGVHWQMADPSIAIDRRIKNKVRMSERNKVLGMGVQHWNVTEEWIRADCDCHLDDPIIEALCPINDKIPAEITALSKLFIQEEVMVDLRNQLKDRENQILELHQKMQRLEAITSSTTWRVARKFHRIIDTIFPPNSRIRRLAKRTFLQSGEVDLPQ
jgi:hypothetical protein